MTVSLFGVSGARSQIAAAALAGCLAFGPASAARAQADSVPAAAPESAASTTPRVAEETRARVAEIDLEITGIEALGREWAERTARFAQERQGAPQALAAIDAELAKLKAGAAPSVDPQLSVLELEIELLGREQDLALARREAATIDSDGTSRAERRKQIPELLAAAKGRLRDLDTELGAPPDEPSLAEARQRLTRARREAVEHEIAAYEEELRSYDARGQLLALRRERTALSIAALEAEVALLRDAFAALRQGEAEIAAEEALRSLEFAEAMPVAVLEVARSVAADNRELALRRTGPDGLLQKIEETSRKLSRAEEQVADVSADHERLRRNVEAAGLSGSVGFRRSSRKSWPSSKGFSRPKIAPSSKSCFGISWRPSVSISTR
jgi:chromosome segregation ATPase